MKEIRYTLITDGSSDRALMPILNWLLMELGVNIPIQAAWADLARLPHPPKKLEDRIEKAIALYPCDLLFIHRDAEKETRQKRVSEIHQAVNLLKEDVKLPVVCVIPVKMTEAWLLIDEKAIREAAGNPKGSQSLNLPKPSTIEKLSDLKENLKALLELARGHSSRKSQKFLIARARIAELIDDFHPLKQLPAFMDLESELKQTLGDRGWISDLT
jgi:hypothetical protein